MKSDVMSSTVKHLIFSSAQSFFGSSMVKSNSAKRPSATSASTDLAAGDH